jgi:hypothetical protein
VPEPATSFDTAVLNSACPTCRGSNSITHMRHDRTAQAGGNYCALQSATAPHPTLPSLLAVNHTLQHAALQPCTLPYTHLGLSASAAPALSSTAVIVGQQPSNGMYTTCT